MSNAAVLVGQPVRSDREFGNLKGPCGCSRTRQGARSILWNTVVKLCESHLANRHRTRRHSEGQMPAGAEQSRSCSEIRV
jgi:hypothetical protein